MPKNHRNNKHPNSRERRHWHEDLKPETKKSLFAILLFALAIVTILAYWQRAGRLGYVLADGLTTAFSKAYFLAPVTLIFIGLALVLSLRRHLYAATLIGGTLFLLSSLALVDLLFNNHAAGWIGFAANWPLEHALDFWAALVVEASVFAASILITANIPIWRLRPGDTETPVGALGEPKRGMATSPVEEKPPAPSPKTDALAPAAILSESRPLGREDRDEFSVAKKWTRRSAYVFPPLHLLSDDRGTPSSGDIRANANIIRRTLLNFGIDVEMGEVSVGPTVTQYTLKPAEGVKLSRIVALQSDLALALAAHPIRIEAPIPGKSLVGIEVPNRSIALVGLRSLLEHDTFQSSPAPLLFALGRDVAGSPVYANLAKMPHLLVAGATGAGKSVALHAMITSFLYRNPPEMLKFIMVDPKRVELAVYASIPHLLTAPITDAKKTIQALRWTTKEMERRYQALAGAGVRDLASFNAEQARRSSKEQSEPMPYLVVVIDELADLMATFPREVEASIVRLAQMARAVGIHLVVSTQRPSVEVITGLIKANITSRIAFQVASQVDSRTILDVAGSEKLLGNGDMLFLAGDTAKPRRIQGGFVSEEEVEGITAFVKKQIEGAPAEADAEEIFNPEGASALAQALNTSEGFDDDEDPLYDEARTVIVQAGKGSASYLQRRLKVGYARAARLLDLLEERGVIGPGDGAKPREVLVKNETSEV